MFSSINFLFLSSLAFISWIILCYFKQIEESRVEGLNLEINMERKLEESTGVQTTACRLLENYDIYLNFIYIFACIYALAKVTQFTESYIARQVRAKFGGSQVNFTQIGGDQVTEKRSVISVNTAVISSASTHAVDSIAPSQFTPIEIETEQNRLKQYQHYHKNLLLQIALLKRRNTELETLLCDYQEADNFDFNVEVNTSPKFYQPEHRHEMQPTKFIHHGMDCQLSLQELKPNEPLSLQRCLSPKTFVTNRRFQANNRGIYMNEGNVKMNLNEGGNFTEIWLKYLEMQKFAIQSPQIGDGVDSDTPEFTNQLPVVMSTEELQTTLQG